MNKNKNIGDAVKNIKKKPLSSKTKKRIAIIFACIFLVYCTILFIKLVRNPVETFIVENGKIYKEETVEGYIIRDEKIVDGDSRSRKNSSIKS